MNTKQKKSLYESIMKSVAKSIKKQLNEGQLEFEELDYIGRFIRNMCSDENKPISELQKTLFINLDLGIDMPNKIKSEIVKRSAGFFVEGIFANIIMQIANNDMNTTTGLNRNVNVTYNGNTALYDLTMEIESLGDYNISDGQVGEDIYGEEVDLTPGEFTDGPSRTFNFEIKAFNGKTSNITLTEPQREALNNKDANVYYILVDYSLSGSIDKIGIDIKHVYILDSDDATNLITSTHINTNVLQNAYLVF